MRKKGEKRIAVLVAEILEEGGEKAEQIRRTRAANGLKAAQIHANLPNLSELNKKARAVLVAKKRATLKKRGFPPCPRCHSMVVRLNGKRPDGEQNYKCSDCGRSFLNRPHGRRPRRNLQKPNPKKD